MIGGPISYVNYEKYDRRALRGGGEKVSKLYRGVRHGLQRSVLACAAGRRSVISPLSTINLRRGLIHGGSCVDVGYTHPQQSERERFRLPFNV